MINLDDISLTERNILEKSVDYIRFSLSPDQIRKNEDTINRDPGLYFLIFDDEIVYVGRSKNVMSRIINHLHTREILFNRYTIINMSYRDTICLEPIYINKFNPKYNGLG